MSQDQLEDRARTGQLGERSRSARGGRGDRGLPTAPMAVQPAPAAERGGRSGWLLLLLPLIATLAAGAWFGRSYLSDEGGTTLASTDSSQVSPSTGASAGAKPSSAPSASAAAGSGPSSAANDIDLGQVSGRYVLKGPATAPAGSVVVFVLSGPKRAVHTGTSAPYDWSFDSRRIPNGTYTVGMTVIRPGLPAQSQNRLMEVANAKQAAPKAPATKPATKAPTGGGSTGSTGAGGSGGSTGTVPAPGLSTQAAEVLSLTNAERAKAGCKALKANSKLTAAAQAHSADMAKNDYFAHDSQDGTSPFDRIKDVGYNFRAAAENIAYGQTSAASVMDAWMNSAGHKANILNCAYTQIGIGYATRGTTPYWTQDFGSPL